MLFGQLLNFLAAASEDKRVAAFQACYFFTLPGIVNQQGIDILLRYRMIRTRFTHINQLGIFAHHIQHSG